METDASSVTPSNPILGVGGMSANTSWKVHAGLERGARIIIPREAHETLLAVREVSFLLG